MIHHGRPYVIRLSAGEHRLCGCGNSAEFPLCDGEDGAECRRAAVPLLLAQPRVVAVCACGRTSTPPYCDGSHGNESSRNRKVRG